MICPICSITKVKTAKGLVMHQATDSYCLQVQSDRSNAQNLKTECKPRGQGVAKRKGNLDEAEEAPPCKKEVLVEKVMSLKLAMMAVCKRGGCA